MRVFPETGLHAFEARPCAGAQAGRPGPLRAARKRAVAPTVAPTTTIATAMISSAEAVDDAAEQEAAEDRRDRAAGQREGHHHCVRRRRRRAPRGGRCGLNPGSANARRGASPSVSNAHVVVQPGGEERHQPRDQDQPAGPDLAERKTRLGRARAGHPCVIWCGGRTADRLVRQAARSVCGMLSRPYINADLGPPRPLTPRCAHPMPQVRSFRSRYLFDGNLRTRAPRACPPIDASSTGTIKYGWFAGHAIHHQSPSRDRGERAAGRWHSGQVGTPY